MNFKSPSLRSLLLCWLVLLILTLGTMISGRVTSNISLTTLLIISLGLITWFKTLLILRYYLNLKSASKGWNHAFGGYLFVLLGLITLIFLTGKL